MQFYLALAIIFSVTIAVFAIQNSSVVTISFLVWELPGIPLVIVILFSALIGMLVAFLFGATKQYKLSKQLSEITDNKMLLEQELSKLKVQSNNSSPQHKV